MAKGMTPGDLWSPCKKKKETTTLNKESLTLTKALPLDATNKLDARIGIDYQLKQNMCGWYEILNDETTNYIYPLSSNIHDMYHQIKIEIVGIKFIEVRIAI